jgi:hypothetical protein
MSDQARDDARTVAEEIVRYLLAHPDAADTVEGAARWWLGREPSDVAVERGMLLLVGQGLVERHLLPDGTTVFRSGAALHDRREPGANDHTF